MEAVPPVNSALPRRSGGGAGVRTFRQTIGNDGTQSYGTTASGVYGDPLRYVRRVAIRKPSETVGRKANWGLRRARAMPARPPDTLHPSIYLAKRGLH